MDKFESRFARTRFLVEATHAESFFIWQENAKQSRRPKHDDWPLQDWEQLGDGWIKTIGHMDNRPINLSFWWYRIDGILVGFYEACSQIVDYAVVEKWIADNFKGMYDNGTRRAITDASNFGACVSAIKEFKALDNA